MFCTGSRYRGGIHRYRARAAAGVFLGTGLHRSVHVESQFEFRRGPSVASARCKQRARGLGRHKHRVERQRGAAAVRWARRCLDSALQRHPDFSRARLCANASHEVNSVVRVPSQRRRTTLSHQLTWRLDSARKSCFRCFGWHGCVSSPANLEMERMNHANGHFCPSAQQRRPVRRASRQQRGETVSAAPVTSKCCKMMSRKKSRSGRQGKARDRSRHSDARNAFRNSRNGGVAQAKRMRRCQGSSSGEPSRSPNRSKPPGMRGHEHDRPCMRPPSLSHAHARFWRRRSRWRRATGHLAQDTSSCGLRYRSSKRSVCMETGQGSKGGKGGGGGSGPHDAPAADPDGSKQGGCNPKSRIRSQTRRTLTDGGETLCGLAPVWC